MTPVEIKLYQTASEPTMVKKTLVEKATVTGYFKQVQDITAPVIDLAFNDRDTFNLYFNSNYAYIALFNRYYFISRKEVGMNNILSIYMDEDVLMSFKNEIYNLVPLVTRQATDYNIEYSDDMLVPLVKPHIELGDLSISYTGGFKVLIDNKVYVEYDKNNIVDFCKIFSGGCPCVALKAFSIADTGTTYESKWVQNGGTYINRTYFMDIDDAASAYEWFAGSDVFQNFSKWYQDASTALNYIKMIPFDCIRAAVGLVKTDTIKMVGLSDLKPYGMVSGFSADHLYMDTQNSFFILAVQPLDIDLRPTKTFLDYNYRIVFTFPFVGDVSISYSSLIAMYNITDVNNSTANLHFYIIISTSNLTGRVYILRRSLGLEYENPETLTNFKGIASINASDIIYESDPFECGIEVPLGSSNMNGIALKASIIGLKAVFASTGNIAAITSAGLSSLPEDKSAAGTVLKPLWEGTKETIDLTNQSKASARVTTRGGYGFQPFMTSKVFYQIIGSYSDMSYNDYKELYGIPLNKTKALSTFKGKGFTKCANVHMTGFTNATSEEISEIESLLLSGVIL